MEVNFIVVDAYFSYTAIVARPWLHAMGAVSSTLHLKVKYLSGDQVEELVGSQFMARQCLVANIKHQTGGESSASAEQGLQQSWVPMRSIDMVVEEVRCEELEKFITGDNEGKFFQVGIQLPPQENEELIGFLKRNIDVFAQSAYEAPRVDPNFIFHYLNINPFIIPKKQPPRCSSKEHSDVVKEKVAKLKRANTIKEVFFYPEW